MNLLVSLNNKLQLSEASDEVTAKERIITYLNDLIANDFPRLVHLLYRFDIDESLLRSVLRHQEGHDTAQTILDLLIEREYKRQESRRMFRKNDDEIPEDEKWTS